jgi:tetratricopeptide (TPR) repeat protein
MAEARPPKHSGRKKPAPGTTGGRKPSSVGDRRGPGRPSSGKGSAAKGGAGKGSAGKGGSSRRTPERTGGDRRGSDRVRDPRIPDEIDISDLDPGVLNELRTLPEGLAEMVGRHLVAAEYALLDDDVALAQEHVGAAGRRAARVPAVREAAGIVAYRAGDYAGALRELRAVRRMTGAVDFLPMMADCERGLGRPERALELLKELRTRDVDLRIEGLLVSAGARADMGQLDAALVTLKVPELTSLPPGSTRARLQFAYADLLALAGREAEAQEWFAQAVKSDTDDVTDASERLA